MSFKAIRVLKKDDAVATELTELELADLDEGDVVIDVEYSTINYKDGLAVAYGAPVVRRFPLIPGIDAVGVVSESTNPGLAPGDKVVVNGWGLGENRHGGFAQKTCVPGEWPIKLPAGISTRQAAAIGTAGYTAMLGVLALERNGVTPDKGDVLVTGANGGVGSVAIAILSKLGYRVVASTGRLNEADYLKDLGAAEIIDRKALSEPSKKPLGSERWAGAVDSVGSHTLVNVLSQIKYGGAVSSNGLVQGSDLPGTVMPFILRGVTLAGIDSVRAPRTRRLEAWSRLARDLDLGKLEKMASVTGLKEAPEVAKSILKGGIRGRTIVDVNA